MELSTIYVDSKEDAKVTNPYTNARRELVTELNARGFPAESCKNLPVDIMWSAGGRSCMFDLATPEDMLNKVEDGRMHEQSEAMKARDPLMWGFLIEGSIYGDGYTVGHAEHAWAFERFDNLLLSLQMEGAVIVHSPTPARTPVRLGALYSWSGKEKHGSHHRVPRTDSPVGHHLDKATRARIRFLMSIPGVAQVRAEKALRAHKLADLVRLDEELEKRWASVDGIGKHTAQRVRAFLEGE